MAERPMRDPRVEPRVGDKLADRFSEHQTHYTVTSTDGEVLAQCVCAKCGEWEDCWSLEDWPKRFRDATIIHAEGE